MNHNALAALAIFTWHYALSQQSMHYEPKEELKLKDFKYLESIDGPASV